MREFYGDATSSATLMPLDLNLTPEGVEELVQLPEGVGSGWLLTSIITNNKSRRAGAGTALLTTILTEADAEGEWVFLSLQPESDTHLEWVFEWYQRVGFSLLSGYEAATDGLWGAPMARPPQGRGSRARQDSP